MERPQSIVWFERCYLGCVLVGLVNTATQWGTITEKMAENPQTAALGPAFVPTMLGVGLVLGLVVSGLLWYFVARKGAAVAKWIVTILFALNLVTGLLAIAGGNGPQGISGVLAIVALVLNGLAVWQLFKPDTKAWFGEAAA